MLGGLPNDRDRVRPRRDGAPGQGANFICGADHPTTVALKLAAESGAESDIKKARALFVKLKPSDRRGALAMLSD